MPTIPVTTPFSDGTVADEELLNDALYRPLATPVNMSITNGQLDSANIDAAFRVDSSDVQGGAFTTAAQVGATGSNDYFYNFYEEIELELLGGAIAPWIADIDNIANADPLDSTPLGPHYVLIPGASQKFYLEYSCTVLLFWHVETEAKNNAPSASSQVNASYTSLPPPPVQTDSGATNDALSLRLFVDGDTVAAEKRQLKCNVTHPWYVDGSGFPLTYSVNVGGLGAVFRRKWSGHYVVQLAAGWHNAGIGIVHQVYHVRTVTKRFGYVAMRA